MKYDLGRIGHRQEPTNANERIASLRAKGHRVNVLEENYAGRNGEVLVAIQMGGQYRMFIVPADGSKINTEVFA